MKSNVLKITVLNQLNNIKWAFFSSLIYYFIIDLVFGDTLFRTENSLIIVAHLWVIIPLIIVIYIHITYFFENKDFNFKVKNKYIFDVLKNKKIYNVYVVSLSFF